MGSVSTQRKFGVVTGGTSGIGLELAKQFLANGFDVLIAGDRKVANAKGELGLDADGGTVYALGVDLGTADGCRQLVAEIERIGRPIDAIAINAGVGVSGRFVETNLDEELAMIDLNCVAVVRIAKSILPGMIARGEGRILITSSVAGTMPAPYLAVYGATKAFDLSFAEALRYELRDTGVTVTALQPGATDTDFFERARMEDTKVGQGEKDDPALVAEQGFKAMMRGDDKIYAGSITSRLQGIASEVLPETTKAKMHGKTAEPGSGRKS
jgi:uncharacterized protein